MAKIMAWSKCKVELGDTGASDAFATSLTDVGVVKQNGVSLSANEGDTLEAKDSGGATVAREQQEGSLDLSVTIIEPTEALYTALGIASAATGGEQKIKTFIVPNNKSVKVTPKNKGAKGLKAPVCRVSVNPAFGNDTGNELTLVFHIQKTTEIAAGSGGEDNNYMISYFTTTTNLT